MTACISRISRVLTGEGIESLEPGLHGADVVDDLLDIRPEGLIAGFGIEHLD